VYGSGGGNTVSSANFVKAISNAASLVGDGDVSVNFQSMVQNGEWNQSWTVRLSRRFAGKAGFASLGASRSEVA
jgi:hypothetical protein